MGQLSKYRDANRRLIDDASTGTQRPPRVSIGDNRFTLIDPSGERTEVAFLPDGPALDVVFVDRNEHTSKLFWGLGKTYNPSELSPPVCFSDNGVAPSSQAQEPQSPTCNTCPHNAIGSATSQISGAKIRACGDVKKLAVVVNGYSGVYLFEIKPGSFKAWNNYTSFLRLQKLPDGGQPDLSDVITRVKFVGQGLLSFEAIELVDSESEIAQRVIQVWETNKQNDLTGMMIGRFDQPAQGVLPAPKEAEQVPKQVPPPPQPAQPASIFGSKPTEGKRTAKKKDERAPIEPSPPTQAPPSNISARLEQLFKLPAAK